MALLLAPYNNGMRLGQGFNSYTQQICIDDAVVIDPDRIDNAVTNDGFTMRELRYAIGARAGDEEDYYDDGEPLAAPVTAASTGDASADVAAGTQAMIGPAPPTALDSIAIQLTQDVKTVSKLVEDIAKLEAAVEEATDPNSDDTKRDALLLEKKRMRLARIKTTGTGLKSTNARGAVRELSQRGPSQIVSYSSRFVNKISEITDDMNISGSLSIKYGAIGGAGKGSFVDSDKFKESDLNFFISVKVINQSINIKDALVFQGLPSVNKNNFRSVFGDTFISGFLEGGEFNALVSMKVVNKDKRMAIKAEAEIALSVGVLDVKGSAKADIAKSDFSSQTETTIQVGWSGGGHIKPMDQPWTIPTLMETAAKFPDLVANTPQRTYAILTKYESLRSFMALKPPELKPMFYENAAIYTNSMLDAYMDYKNIYRNLGSNLFDIQAGTKKFGDWPEGTAFADNSTLSRIDDESRFTASIKGLDLARRACRFQMVKIVKEVDAIEERPDYAADEKRPEAFQSPIVFRERLPLVKYKEKMPPLKIFGTDVPYPPLLERVDGDGVTDDEAAKASTYTNNQPDISEFLRLAPMVGSVQGALFCHLDFVKADFSLRTVTVELNGGVVCGLTARYANGLLATTGTAGGGRKVSLTVRPEDGEKIIACSIETGRVKGEANAMPRVTALRLYTNRGPDLLGNSEDWKPAVNGEGVRGGVQFEGLSMKHFDPLLVNAHIKGFWGYGVSSSRLTPQSGIFRLGPIWGNKEVRLWSLLSISFPPFFQPTNTMQNTSPTSGVVEDDTVTTVDIAQVQKALDESKRALARLEGCVGSPTNGPVCILSVTWGGQCYDGNQSVRNRLISLIVENREFRIGNDICEHDPMPGTRKWLSVAYRFTEGHRNGRVRTLVGYEGNNSRFDALDSQ
ncbi:uncharacterized protein ACLA_013960 [Aspergillus clavatus NRRL 1]|uniref:Uncharacterized protein n=1 Tax=Aspergillus clavatus (strain ATCC 1007 / CBS 513.65 / DSM 816 / NCTC 3887 / NRRL 1 / QM 1276 / 107) TaxID=344612 RepID=A1CB41_ASPCL|nr:uncharacterized protein ACLA_013960 [Aspergillus clavatus NRRL 1]EAW12959.1 conserved hypothetical protein [Aspergillus clavatus NRRL 1]